MRRHPLEHAEHEAKLLLLKAALVFCGGILFLFWPLLLGMHTDAHGTEQVKGWTWAIEIPWLIIAVALIAAVARARRRR